MTFKICSICLLVLTLLGVHPVCCRVIERTRAVVNGQVITDITIARYRLLNSLLSGSDPLDDRTVSERLINRTLLLQEIRRLGFVKIDSTELDNVLEAVISSGEDKEGMLEKARRYGLTLNDIRSYLRGKLEIESFVEQRVGAFVDVSPSEIEEFISQELKLSDAAGLEETVIENIRCLIRTRKIDARLADLMLDLRSRSRIEHPLKEEKAER